MPHLPIAVAVIAAVLSAVLAVWHAVRIVMAGRRGAPLPGFLRWLQPGGVTFVAAELGHLAVAGGMAVMFVGPASWVGSPVFALGYLVIALAFLVLVLTDPGCCESARWSCCALLVVEALAMACMARAGQWPVGAFDDPGGLTGWFVAVFIISAFGAVIGPLVRRPASVGPAAALSITPMASRLIMAGGMLLMLV